jgi:hypothetical protein
VREDRLDNVSLRFSSHVYCFGYSYSDQGTPLRRERDL